MGIEQNSDLQMKIATANNQVFVAKSNDPGSIDHAIALMGLARLLADHREGPAILKGLNKQNKKINKTQI